MMRFWFFLFVVVVASATGSTQATGSTSGKQTSVIHPVAANLNVAGRVDDEEDSSDWVKIKFEVKEEATAGFTYEPKEVIVYQPDGKYYCGFCDWATYPDEYMIEEGLGWELMVPKGRYDLILRSDIRPDNIDPDDEHTFLYDSYVIAEDIEISEDMTYVFTQSDAKNKLSCKFFYPDGSQIPYDNLKDETGELSMMYYRELKRKDGSYPLVRMMINICYEEFFVNNLSDKWTLSVNNVAADSKATYINFITSDGPFDDSRCMYNGAELYNEPVHMRFAGNLAGQKDDASVGGITAQTVWNGTPTMTMPVSAYSFDMKAESRNLPVYINAPVLKEQSSPDDGWNFVFAGIGGYSYTDNEWTDSEGNIQYDRQYSTMTSPWIYTDTDGHMWCIPPAYTRSDENDYELFFPADYPLCLEYREDMEFYNEAPLVGFSYSLSYDEWQDKNLIYFDTSCLFPCLGNLLLLAKITVRFNGETIAEGADSFDFIAWTSNDNAVSGLYDIYVEMPYSDSYSSSLRVMIDNTSLDNVYSQVYRWQLRDASGNLTQDATRNSHIIIEHSPGTTPLVQISEHEKDLWTPLEYNQYINDGYGKVSVPHDKLDADKWYDLRFICKDSAGNDVVQTVAHAFHKGQTGGITTIRDTDTLSLTSIHLLPPDCKIYNLSGMEISRGSLRSGLYIINNRGKVAKVMITD